MAETILDNLLGIATENEVVEFKEAKNQYAKDKLGKYFSALSNEANLNNKNKAWVVLGVKDNKTIVGTTITPAQLNEFKTEIGQHTSPRSNFVNVHRIVKEGKTVLMLEIPPAPQGMPVSWKGFNYGRDGESLVALNSNEYDKIRAQANAIDWSAQIVKEATIQDLSSKAIAQARIHFIQKNKKLETQITSWSDKVFLNKAKITIKGKITNTAIILLGAPEADHFINPATSKITWILKDSDNIEKDYEHFSCPLLLSVEGIYGKIRNLKYRYIKDNTLFPDEVDQYDPYIIREALNNCIVHQDYTIGGKIIVVENENSVLTFVNSGSFIPESVEQFIIADAPEPNYRNKFLAEAMVNLNMIDTIGSGIKRMFSIQRKKYFPLPEYNLANNKVQVSIVGKVLDMNYARKVAQMPNLTLEEIIVLDKVAKKKDLTPVEIKALKGKKLIEGRKPNFYISSKVAKATNLKDEYMKMQGIDNDYIQKIIVDYITKFGSAKKNALEKILMNKLSEGLNIEQKRNKIKNNLQVLKNKGSIKVEKKIWIMSKPKS